MNGEIQMKEYFGKTTVSKVRQSSGHLIKTYKQLIDEVSIIAKSNKMYDLFFRGQNEDYKDKNNRTIIYPQIYRPEKDRINTCNVKDKYNELLEFSDFMRKNSNYDEKFYEYYFSIIQHYKKLPTPLIDITQSIRTAATFAFKYSNSKYGYFYVFGLPYIQGSISHYVDLNITLVKLLGVCPINAKRPHYQEGFLVGKFPFSPQKEKGDNLAYRLIAKFKLDNSNNDFWCDYFRELPDNVIYPVDDLFEIEMCKLYEKFKINKNGE